MDKKGIALITLFMVFIGFQAAAPAAAVKVIDHGTHYFTYENSNMKEVWKTYQYNNNFIKEYALFYYKTNGKYHFAFHEVTTITKVTPSTVKIKEWTDTLCKNKTNRCTILLENIQARNANLIKWVSTSPQFLKRSGKNGGQ